jgi:hypothetical protein
MHGKSKDILTTLDNIIDQSDSQKNFWLHIIWLLHNSWLCVSEN